MTGEYGLGFASIPPDRDSNPRRIRNIDRKAWKSVPKPKMPCIATRPLSGDTLKSRLLANQMVDIKLGGKVFNILFSLGMPGSFKVAT